MHDRSIAFDEFAFSDAPARILCSEAFQPWTPEIKSSIAVLSPRAVEFGGKEAGKAVFGLKRSKPSPRTVGVSPRSRCRLLPTPGQHRVRGVSGGDRGDRVELDGPFEHQLVAPLRV